MTPASDSGGRIRVLVALATVYLVWGSSYLATKVMVSAEPPLLAAGLRFTLAGLLLGAFAWWRSGPPRIGVPELRHVAVVAAGGVVISNGINVLGMQHVASNVVALLNATPALIIGWLGTFGRRATPLSGPARTGLGLGLLGVLLVLDPGDEITRGSSLGWQLVILVGCTGWSLATVYFRNATIANTPTMFLSMQMLVGGLALLVLSTLAGEPRDMQWTGPAMAAFLWLTLMSSCLAYSAFTFLTLNTAPVIVGSYAFVNPCIAALLGWLALGEDLAPRQIGGMAIILVAVALASGYAERLVRLAERATKP
jgi:drug/metabolite transporter (DMT)-like permease